MHFGDLAICCVSENSEQSCNLVLLRLNSRHYSRWKENFFFNFRLFHPCMTCYLNSIKHSVLIPWSYEWGVLGKEKILCLKHSCILSTNSIANVNLPYMILYEETDDLTYGVTTIQGYVDSVIRAPPGSHSRSYFLIRGISKSTTLPNWLLLEVSDGTIENSMHSSILFSFEGVVLFKKLQLSR